MKVGVPRETRPGERRVALVPESVKKLAQAGIEVTVEACAGTEALFPDPAYVDAGARIEADSAQIYAGADLVLKVRAPTIGEEGGRDEVGWMRPGQILLSSLTPARNLRVVKALAERGVTFFSSNSIPRITRAQSMDTLSSMASIAGYRGVILAAAELPKYFPMLMTAAGTVLPAKVFVIGAGVAGLQAIATAHRLGATVYATDVRPEVKEQIESVGGKYVGIELTESAAAGGGYAKELSADDRAHQRELLADQCAQSDVVITTALIGGVFAPKLISAEMVARMKPGTILVDLAADGGGNCELTRPGETIVTGGVKILGPLNLAATMPRDASLLLSRNFTNFLLAFWKNGSFSPDMQDEIIQGTTVTHGGAVVHAKTRDALEKLARAGGG
jgi:H+-translocating NAD(P) transhydrogenase subunit alpha